MIIKVCGMRDADNIREVSELDIDMMGFIFWKDSPRFVRMISSHAGIIPDYSEERLNKNSGKVVNDQPQTIVTRIYNYELDYVQLHGEESCIMIDNLRRTLEPDIRTGVKIIKTISVSSAEDIEKTKEYEGCVDLFLFDTKCPTMGGSGDKFDWSVLSAYKGNVPFLLSGGIGMDDVDKIKSFQHPQFAGVDVNSCFETEPGVKDVEKLRLFIEKLRHE